MTTSLLTFFSIHDTLCSLVELIAVNVWLVASFSSNCDVDFCCCRLAASNLIYFFKCVISSLASSDFWFSLFINTISFNFMFDSHYLLCFNKHIIDCFISFNLVLSFWKSLSLWFKIAWRFPQVLFLEQTFNTTCLVLSLKFDWFFAEKLVFLQASFCNLLLL